MDDDDCVEASLAAAVGGAALAVSLVAGLLVVPLVAGVNGADATDGSALELGVEGAGLETDSVFNGAGLSAAACELAGDGVERGGEATLERVELLLVEVLDEVVATLVDPVGALGAAELLRLGVGAAAAPASATLATLSGAGVDTSAGAGVLGAALPESALLAVCVTGSGVLTTLSLRL